MVFKKNGKKYFANIEIKGDRKHFTGNFFFETVSNLNKNTKGCMLYTESDYVFYYFIDTCDLYLIPTKKNSRMVCS